MRSEVDARCVFIAGSSRQTDRMDDRNGCPFCAICDGEAPADVVLADDVAVAFLDRSPLFKPVTCWSCPDSTS